MNTAGTSLIEALNDEYCESSIANRIFINPPSALSHPAPRGVPVPARRPSELDRRLPTALPVPNSPSYPSEHAAAAQAAATVLAYFLPAEAQSFQEC